jgi:hypothetical protein
LDGWLVVVVVVGLVSLREKKVLLLSRRVVTIKIASAPVARAQTAESS